MALEFNGSSDYVELARTSAATLRNDFTIEAWMLTTTSTEVHRIISNHHKPEPRIGFGIGLGIINNRFRYTSFNIYDYESKPETVTTDAWTHIAVTVDGYNTVTFYRNGIPLQTVKHNRLSKESILPLNIGRNPIGTEYWQGCIDEIRIWDYVRPSYDIGVQYNRQLTGSEPGLVGYYPFSEGTGTKTTDASPKEGDGTLHGCKWVTGPSLLPPMQTPLTR